MPQFKEDTYLITKEGLDKLMRAVESIYYEMQDTESKRSLD